MECIDLKLCKHMKKGQKQPSSHSYNKLSKTQYKTNSMRTIYDHIRNINFGKFKKVFYRI